MTKFYVDTAGNYLGGFDGYVPTQPIIEKKSAVDKIPVFETVTDGAGRELFINGAPVQRQARDAKGLIFEDRKREWDEIVGMRELPKVYPEIPAGAVEVPAPPRHGRDTYDAATTEWVSHIDGVRYRVQP